MKNFLFLSPFFYPEEISTGKYNSLLVQKLLEQKHRVDVVALHPFYPKWVVEKSSETFHEARLFRYGENLKFPKNQLLRRLFLELMFLYYVRKHLRNSPKSYDTVVVVFPPVMFYAFSGWLKRYPSTIGIIHDVQGIMAKTETSFIRKVSAFIIERAEKKAYNGCGKIICLSKSMLDVIVNRYGIEASKCVAYYPFITGSAKPAIEINVNLLELFDPGFIHIVYSGALGEKQQPHQLLNFFQVLTGKANGIKCHFFSRGPLFDEINKISQGLDNRNIMFHDLVTEHDLPELYARSTIQIVPQAPGTGAGAFPSKLPNLLAHGTPIFAICDPDSELDHVLGSLDTSKVCHSWNLDDLCTQMLHFIRAVQGVSRKEILQQNRISVLKQFDVNSLVEEISAHSST